MSRAYYNEIEPYCVAWLKNLIAARLIPEGDVDDRSIEDVQPGDLEGYVQCHFFAGIGGWAYALRLAGWPDDRPIWTGSCPCQPFSVAGKRKGTADKRHLWPEFQRLINKRRPPSIFGEQVAAATQWLAGVRGDLEAMDYAVGAIPIEAACKGSHQFRDRFWFVACDPCQLHDRAGEAGSRGRTEYTDVGERGGVGLVAHECSSRLEEWNRQSGNAQSEFSTSERACSGAMEHTPRIGWGKGWTIDDFRSGGITTPIASVNGCQFIECPDGKWRALPPPRVRWLGNGIPARISKLRAYGNAIVPQVAAEFIAAYMEVIA
jgi:DNA (cytosine-5)-methyltransferase 1